MDPGGRPDARHATGSTQSAVFCCPVMMVTKILVELWKKLFFCQKLHFWQNSGLLAQKSVFGTALMGMIFFHLTLLWYQNIKTSLCTLFKNVWVMPFFITFRSARKKLQVAVFFYHPVPRKDSTKFISPRSERRGLCIFVRGVSGGWVSGYYGGWVRGYYGGWVRGYCDCVIEWLLCMQAWGRLLL